MRFRYTLPINDTGSCRITASVLFHRLKLNLHSEKSFQKYLNDILVRNAFMPNRQCLRTQEFNSFLQ